MELFMKKSKRIYVIFVVIITIISLVVFFLFQNKNDKTTIVIGVPEITSYLHNYQQLKADLEKKFDITVKFEELYPNIKNRALTEKDVIETTYNKANNGEIDIIIGITPNKLSPLVESNLLLNLTDKINCIDNIHKGVIDSSKKGGDGNIYFISPVIKNIYFVLQNENIFNNLGVEPLSLYPSYDEFLNCLQKLKTSNTKKGLSYSPIALAVKNFDSNELFIGSQYRMYGYNLNSPYNKLNQKNNNEWFEFYKYFATLVQDYGKGYEEYENGIYPEDNIFSTGNYGCVFANTYTMELYMNKYLNEEHNKQSPIAIKPNFPIKVSFLPCIKNNAIQNIRQSSFAIVRNSKNTDIALKILNYVFSEEYTLKMIKGRGIYNHFCEYPFAYPAFYSEKTISYLNKFYDGKFDTSVIYDVKGGSEIETCMIPENSTDFDKTVNQALTSVYNHEKTINESFNDIVNFLNQQ